MSHVRDATAGAQCTDLHRQCVNCDSEVLLRNRNLMPRDLNDWKRLLNISYFEA
jgi:hypothetical protein